MKLKLLKACDDSTTVTAEEDATSARYDEGEKRTEQKNKKIEIGVCVGYFFFSRCGYRSIWFDVHEFATIHNAVWVQCPLQFR